MCECVFWSQGHPTGLHFLSPLSDSLTASRTSCEQQKWKLALLPVCLSASAPIFLFVFPYLPVYPNVSARVGFEKKKKIASLWMLNAGVFCEFLR